MRVTAERKICKLSKFAWNSGYGAHLHPLQPWLYAYDLERRFFATI